MIEMKIVEAVQLAQKQTIHLALAEVRRDEVIRNFEVKVLVVSHYAVAGKVI